MSISKISTFTLTSDEALAPVSRIPEIILKSIPEII